MTEVSRESTASDHPVGEPTSVSLKTCAGDPPRFGPPRACLCIHAVAFDGRVVDLTSHHELHPDASLGDVTKHLTVWVKKIGSTELHVKQAWVEIPLNVGEEAC